ncbi:hypothetical protein Bandiella_01392 [Candidatus Bandiella woodruffii]|uniref:Lipoprotein n=1 Tax=Candidatus Bandiella euplotis TaxID=1664265 RepID=A0ABZ0UQQ3_9RICK|nr:hypothetical protein Bandiella_01392 [Candidatus Bandiella woodruffii]
MQYFIKCLLLSRMFFARLVFILVFSCMLNFNGHRQVKKVEVQKVLREEGKNSKLEQNKK